MKALIVDDDFANRIVIQSFLKDKANPVHCASNGQEAVEAYQLSLEQGEPYNVILMDIMMPVMDGHEAVKTIRQMEQDKDVPPGQETKVIMISCLEDQKNVCHAFFHGQATCYLTKPVSKQDLEAAMSDIAF